MSESEVERRRRAVELVVDEGMSLSSASDALGRSRQWVHKWVSRFREEGESGLEDRSRAPKNPPAGVDETTLAVVLRIRAELEANPVASIGAESIQATMERQGWEPIPSVPSIERILRRAGVTRPYRQRHRSGIRLPIPVVTRPGIWQQVDWIQDRWLEGGIRFNSIQAGCVGSDGIASEQYVTRTVANASEFLLGNAWPTLSIPYAIGVDNAFVKTTHPNNPYTVFVRLCLYFGVEVVVAPPGGLGWTNHVEAVNNLWQARTIRARRFSSLEELRAGSAEACHWLNHYRPVHDPATHGTRYPIDLIAAHHNQLRWPPTITLDDHRTHKGQIHIPLAAGRITYIRHATDQRTIEIANVAWTLPYIVPVGGLVIATITTQDAALTLRHRNEVIATHPYPITHPIVTPYHPPNHHGLLDQLSAMS